MPIQITQTEHDHIPETFSIEALKEAGMTDQEITALSEGDDPIVEPAPDEKPGEAAPDDPDAADGLGKQAQGAEEGDIAEDKPVVQDEPGADGSKAAAEAEAAKADPFADIEPPKLPDTVDVSEHQETIKTSKAELASLMEKYDDGELTADEFSEQQDAIIERQAEARAAIKAAENTAQSGAQAIEQHWYNTLDTYKGLGTEALWSEDHLADWDRHLRTVTSQEKYASLSLPKQIEMAHRLYAAEYEATHDKPLGIPLPGQAAQPEAKADDGEKIKVREDKRPDAPQTLAGMNSDTLTEVEDSAFAAVDRQIMKDPVRAEEMVANFTPEQMQRFLEGA